MSRLFLGFSLSTLAVAIVLTGCGPSDKPVAFAQVSQGDKVPPGEAKPIPPGEAKPIPGDPPPDLPSDLKTDADTLPVLPTLSQPTGDEKYEASLGRAFLLMAEKRDAEALEALKEAQAVQDNDVVKSEIERLETRIARDEAARQASEDIQDVLDAGEPAQAAKLAADALATYGATDAAASLSSLKRQADALVSAGLEEQGRKTRFLDEAETARKADNLRSAVISYEQAVANGADVTTLKPTYSDLQVRLAKYDESRTRAGELRKDPYQLEQAIEALKVALESWDTTQVRREISEAEVAINNRRDRVAIADFETINDIGVPRAGHVVAEELVGAMRPRFDVVERSQVRTLLTEMKLDDDDLTTDETARTEFGRIAKARYVLLGSVSRVGGIRVNARLVDTQTGLVVQTARIVAATPEEMTSRLPALGRMLQMNDDEKRGFELAQAEQARPVEPPPAAAAIPEPPPPPPLDVAPPPPAPIIVYSPRPPVYGAVVAADFDGFRLVVANAAPPPVVVVTEAPVLVRDRSFFVAVEVGDNCFRRGDFRLALRHFEFALSLNPGHAGIRARVFQCRPLCPPPVVVVPILRPRLVVLPFAEFRDPFQIPSTIPPNLGLWAGDAISPYFSSRYDVVDKGELFWWMGRLGLTLRDVLTDPHARLCLGRALGARFFLMGSLREVASFDASTHIIDAELNQQVFGSRIRVNNAAELRYRLGELAGMTVMPPAQQVVVVQQQEVVQRKVVAAQLEFRKGNFSLSLGFYKEVLTTNPQHVEARQMMIQLQFRSRQAELEQQRQLAWRQQQATLQAQRDKQIALAAATQAVKMQAKRDAAKRPAAQQTIIINNQINAQQNLVAQAQIAQRQNNLEQRVALLENASAIRRDEKVVAELAEAKAQLAVEREKRLTAEKAARVAEREKNQMAEAAKVEAQLAASKAKKEEAAAARKAAAEAEATAEYDRFIDQGQKAMANEKYAVAATAYQNARRVKRTPEVEQLVSSALVAQARADATQKGDADKKRLEAELAQEESKRKDLEDRNAKLKAKYQAALVQANDAMREKKYEQAVTSYKLASATMQTDEAATGLRAAEKELNKSRVSADKLDNEKADAERKQAVVAKRMSEGREALAAKQFDKATTAFRAAAALKPGDVEIQKALDDAETGRKQAAMAARAAKETQEKAGSLKKLLAAGESNLQKKQFEAAGVAFTDALELDPSNAAAQAGLKQAQAGMGSAKQDAAAMAARKEKREQYEAAMRQGRAAMTQKAFAEAAVAFQKAQALLPGDDASADALAEAKEKQEKAAGAAMADKRRLEVQQALAAGRAALRANQFDDAQAAADRALKANPDNADAKRLVADIADAKRSAAAAMQKKDNAAKKETEGKQAEYAAAMREASTAFANKKYPLAIRKAREALEAKPGDAAATKLANDAQAAAEAGAKMDNDVAKRKEVYDAWLDRGKKLLAARDFDKAEEAFGNALKVVPNDPAATRGLAEARAGMTSKKETPKVEVKPKAKKDVEPKADNAARVAALNKSAAADEADGDYVAAYGKYQEVLKLAPENAKAKNGALFCRWMDQGKKQLAAGENAKAVSSFQEALKIDSEDVNAKKLLKEARGKKK